MITASAPAPAHVHNRNRLLTFILSSIEEEKKKSCSSKKKAVHLCDLTSLPERLFPTTSFPITPGSTGNSPNYKDNIRWFSSSAAEVFAPKIADNMKGWFSSILSSRLPIAG